MSSQINSSSINQSFPVAGVDNNSQGFRDNFTAIKNNFAVTFREMDDLLSKVVVKANLTYGGTTVSNNDLAQSPINNAVFAGCSTAVVDLGTVSAATTITLNFKAGGFQMVTLNGSGVSTVAFSNFPATGKYAEIRFRVYVGALTHTLQLDSTKTYNYVNLLDNVYYSSSTYNFKWPATGTYEYVFSTNDGGGTITVVQYATTVNLKTSVLTSNANTSSDSFGNVTGLTYTALRGRRYNFSAVLPIQHTDAANTHIIAMGFSTGNCVYTVEQQTTPTSAFTISTANTTDSTAGIATSGNANVPRMARVNGIFYDNSSADIAVSVRFRTSGGTLTVLPGASLTFTPIA